jgi:PAS domain S-box-containing protein
LEFQKFDLSDGLPSVECTMGMQTTAVRAADGRIWFATLKGVAVVDPAGLLLNTNPPPVRIEEILVEDARGGRHVVPVSGEGVIELRPDTREVAVYLAGLSFTAPEKMRFAYRLEGVDAEWRDLGNQRTLYFNKPAPGHYRLLARASNNDGLWNETGAVVAFQVQPFLVETLWFRGLVVLVLGGGIGWGFTAYQRSRIRRAEEDWRQQQALAAERARSAALVQHAADAIVLLSGEGRVLYESPSASRAFGQALEPGGVREPFEHVHPDDRERVRGALQAVIAGTHRGGPVEFRVAHPEGGWRHFEAVGTNLLAQPGVEGVLVTAREVTERRRAEAETRVLQAALTEAQRMEAIGQLAGGVAHDFNNILTAILMNVALLQEESDLPVEVRNGLGELEAEARRAANLTRQLLMFSRREVLQTRTFEVHAMLHNLLKMLRRVIGERITLDFNGAAGDLWITADPGMIERVVVNLVVNARDAMPCGGRITLASGETTLDAAPTLHHPEAAHGRFVRLSVTDSGVGMDETTRQRIFEPFFTTKAAGKGTGLGLATVYGIVRQHRGWLEVDSAPGRGTTFHMFLPAAEPAPREPEEQPEPQALPHGDETVLLVEDSERVRRVTASTLRRLGYRVLEADHGPDAVRIWSTEREGIDLLLTDMVMPGDLTGRDLGRQFHREKPALRCLLMSGYSPDLVDGGPLLEHESGFIPKPFEPATLARRVRDCLDGR